MCGGFKVWRSIDLLLVGYHWSRPVYHEQRPIKSWPKYRHRSISVNCQRSIRCNRCVLACGASSLCNVPFCISKTHAVNSTTHSPNECQICDLCFNFSRQCRSLMRFQRFLKIIFPCSVGFSDIPQSHWDSWNSPRFSTILSRSRDILLIFDDIPGLEVKILEFFDVWCILNTRHLLQCYR